MKLSFRLLVLSAVHRSRFLLSRPLEPAGKFIAFLSVRDEGKTKTLPKRSGPTGATRIFKTTWPWSITPSSRASPIRRSWPLATGRTVAFPPTSSSRRPPVSKGAGGALFSSFCDHEQYQRDYEAELGHPWENRAVWDLIKGGAPRGKRVIPGAISSFLVPSRPLMRVPESSLGASFFQPIAGCPSAKLRPRCELHL